MKAPKLVKTKNSQLKVPVTTAGRKMQFFRNSNSSVHILIAILFQVSPFWNKLKRTLSQKYIYQNIFHTDSFKSKAALVVSSLVASEKVRLQNVHKTTKQFEVFLTTDTLVAHYLSSLVCCELFHILDLIITIIKDLLYLYLYLPMEITKKKIQMNSY